MAVRLLLWRTVGVADVREEEIRLDVACDLAQVAVVPGRLGAPEDPRGARGRGPADAEPVTVGGLGAESRLEALVDQRVLALEDHLVHPDGLAVIREPAAHGAILQRRRGPHRVAWPPRGGVHACGEARC